CDVLTLGAMVLYVMTRLSARSIAVSTRHVIPSGARLFDDARDVVFQQVSFRYEFVRSFCHQGDVVLPILVSLFYGRTRIRRLLPLSLRPSKRNERTLHARQRIRGASLLVEQIPTCVRRQRNREFRHSDAGRFVTVGIDLRDEDRERRANL